MFGLLGKKIGMLRMYDEVGEFIVVSVVETGPCVVVQKKTLDSDGYSALQLGFQTAKESSLSKPLKKHFEKAESSYKSHLKEFCVLEKDLDGFSLGQELVIKDVFSVGLLTDVTGFSKGKGFSGVIKRHGFSRGPSSHGSRHHRKPGSVGPTGPSKVFKGKKLPGRMGAEKTTVRNLKIIKISHADNLLFIKGALPGAKGSLLKIKLSLKNS